MEMLGQLQVLMNSLVSDPKMAQLSFVGLLGLAVFVLLMALMMLALGVVDPLKRRLQRLEPQTSPLAATTAAPGAANEGLQGLVAPMGKRLMPTDEAARSKAQNRLIHAGLRGPGALNIFYGARLGLMLLLPTLGLLLASLLRLPLNVVLLIALSCGIVGYLAPSFWVDRRIRQRTLSLRRGLPDALDMLVVCSEAGLGLGASIQRVARDLELSQPELAEEFALYGMQTRAGMDSRAALRDMEERSGVEDIRGLVTSLLQSLRFGTSIAGALRIYSAELRDKRTQEAEEKAAKISTKMLFPLIFCVFPSFFVVALGPPLLGAFEAMNGR